MRYLLTILLVSSLLIVQTVSAIKIDIVGDVDSTSVRDGIKSHNPGKVIVLGDLGYDSNLDWFKTNYWNVFSPNIKCVIGNHDSSEDGGSTVTNQAKELCGDGVWRMTTANKTAIVIGFNSNGDLISQANIAIKWMTNSTYMKTIKNVVFVSHKQCYTPPNAHHPVESKVKAFCDAVTAKIPSSVDKVLYIAGHDHILAMSKDKTKFVSGAGGRSHYDCGTNTVWNYCDNKTYGFLEIKLLNNGTMMLPHFFNSQGVIIK